MQLGGPIIKTSCRRFHFFTSYSCSLFCYVSVLLSGMVVNYPDPDYHEVDSMVIMMMIITIIDSDDDD